MCLWWIYRSHARNRNEIQTSGRRGLAGKIEKLGILIPVNPKHTWKSWNLAWCHDMAPTCCSNFSVRFAKAHTLTINKVILEQVLSRYNRKHKYYWNRGRSTYQLRAATHPFFYWLGGAVWSSYLSMGGVRSDPWACSSGGEPFDRYPPRTSLPTSRLSTYSTAWLYVSLDWDLREKNENLKRKFCTDLDVRSDAPI